MRTGSSPAEQDGQDLTSPHDSDLLMVPVGQMSGPGQRHSDKYLTVVGKDSSQTLNC